MEKIGTPWCFWDCNPQTFEKCYPLLWLSLFLVLLVLTPDFENEVTVAVDRDEDVQWDRQAPYHVNIWNNCENFIWQAPLWYPSSILPIGSSTLQYDTSHQSCP